MIKIILGNVGSGKTAGAVRYMKQNPHKVFYTNIDTFGKNFKHVKKLNADMIIKKEVIGYGRDGTEKIKLGLNVEFWKSLVKKEQNINVIIDEAHIFFNPRRSMSKLNIIMTDFLALLRRVLGSTDGTGELILITQLSRRLDIIAKEMATDVSYSVHHYVKVCSKCDAFWNETNETSNKRYNCPRCNSHYIKRKQSIIEVFEFRNIDSFESWYTLRNKSYHLHYLIKDIHTIFNNYETLQFDDLFSEV